MKFKLDENLGLLGKSLLEADNHDVMTIAEQRLSGFLPTPTTPLPCPARMV